MFTTMTKGCSSMMKTIEIITIFWLLILSLAVLTACTNSDSDTNKRRRKETSEPATSEGTGTEDEKVSIEFWHAMSGSGQESLDAIVKGFNESQDKYEVSSRVPRNL